MVGKRRREDETPKNTGNERKRQRTQTARTIETQEVACAIDTGNAHQANSMEGLPTSLDVEQFADARAFEIRAMDAAMNNARASGIHRAWQTLPRQLRRRAASHDVRRVPVRLRQKARAEMDQGNKKKKVPKNKAGKIKAMARTEALSKRQVDKTWLETHIWHAKRMKMENMWSYRLAVTPTEKSFRPSHRASIHGSILHDASYMAVIELRGPEDSLKAIMETCCDPQGAGPGAVRYMNGSRACHISMYKLGTYPFSLIGPVEIIWQVNAPEEPEQKETQKRKQRESSTFEKETPKQVTVKRVPDRQLWILCHPLLYDEVSSTIQDAVKNQMDAISAANNHEVDILVTDLRNCFNIFELMGPKSSQVIHGALTPVKTEKREEFKQFWNALGQVQTPGSVPRGMIVGCTFFDPRLRFNIGYSFPPKDSKVKLIESKLPSTSISSGLWPTAKLATSSIWNEKVRTILTQPRYTKKEIDARKSENLIPGMKLDPLRQDDRVPALLIQRSIESSVSSAHRKRTLHGWLMVLPKGWGMPFFSSLIYTGTRVGGQREREVQYYEAGCLNYPRDFPYATEYAEFMSNYEREERERWERKPPAKRPSWKKLGTHSPWCPDWEVVLGMKPSSTGDSDLVSAQRDSEGQGQGEQTKPWLLIGQAATSIIEYMSHCPQAEVFLQNKINEFRSKQKLPLLADSAGSLLKSALISVRIVLPCSGSPSENAMIYKMTDEEVRHWRPLLENNRGQFSETELSYLKGSPDLLVGYVTTGGYSLSVGQGQGLGAVSLKSFLDLMEQLHRLSMARSLPLVKIRNKDSVVFRAARLELAG